MHWWEEKQGTVQKATYTPDQPYEPIHMPKNSAIPFIISAFWFFAGFGFVLDWMWMAIPWASLALRICMIVRSFSYDTDYYIPVDEVKRTEDASGRAV